MTKFKQKIALSAITALTSAGLLLGGSATVANAASTDPCAGEVDIPISFTVPNSRVPVIMASIKDWTGSRGAIIEFTRIVVRFFYFQAGLM